MLNKFRKELRKLGNKKKAKLLQGYFKTGKGEYGEGDIFLGIVVPKQRLIAKSFSDLNFVDLQSLINSKVHEERLISLLILIDKYYKAKKNKNQKEIKECFDFYLKNTKKVNNWDLVDLSALRIVGIHLLDKERSILYKLAKSKNLWERRIAIISTFEFIRHNDFKDTLTIAKMLCRDEHDLIHKAVGWALREVGKRGKEGKKLEVKFLRENKPLPSILFSYATEKFSKFEKAKLR